MEAKLSSRQTQAEMLIANPRERLAKRKTGKGPAEHPPLGHAARSRIAIATTIPETKVSAPTAPIA